MLIAKAYLVLFEICSNSPSLVIGECVPVFLKQCVDSRDSTVPRVLQIFQGQTSEERTKKKLYSKDFLELFILKDNKKSH